MSATPASPSPRPLPYLPPVLAPEPGGVPVFPPLRVHGSRQRLRRALLRRRRAVAAGLAVTAAALAVSSTQAAERPHTVAAPASRERGPSRPPAMVSAPVRIADADAVRLLRPGDRVDVIASATSPTGGTGQARVVATGVRVTAVPGRRGTPSGQSGASSQVGGTSPEVGGTSSEAGALVLLAVPREVATALAGAGAASRLAVTLC
ncbi:RcpC/CpaB family pilus assembly protein [Streptomyces sp. NPDC051994]|uniref:RcpC/CpaB family pilus assembly protein n=1 Tax=unclassified Streptomyces TaxID=2593676 RepID=UPI0034168E34